MLRILPFVVLSSLALPLHAQTTGAPRIDTTAGEAGEAAVTINELNSDDYPDVRVIATVTEGGSPLTGLTAEDFRVREDEVDQTPLTVEEQLPPLSVVVVIDTSGSMADAMAATQKAAVTFIEGLPDGDSAQILPFAETAEPATDMTEDRAQATAAIGALTARGDTALYDALARSVELLEDRRGRKASVVLSDGVDDDGAGAPLSTATLDEVLASAARVNVPVFTIGLGTQMDEAVLTQAAEATGAAYLNAPDATELGGVYDRIGAQLSGQYSIRYTSSLPADGTERRVDLEAPQGRDSKSYTPGGTVAAPAPDVSTGTMGCATADALSGARAGLEEAGSLHKDGLISTIDLNTDRAALIQPAQDAAEGSQEAYDCLVTAMAELTGLSDDGLITAITVNSIQGDLADAVGRPCVDETALPAIVACLELFNRARGDGILGAIDLTALRNARKQPLIESLRAMADPRAALETINDLRKRELITAVDLNTLRSEIRDGARP